MHAHQDALRVFLERGLGISAGPAFFMGWARPDGIIASVAFHNFFPAHGTIDISGFAVRRDWLNRARLGEILDYPFNHIGVRLLCSRVSDRNTTARRICKSAGASEYVIPDLLAPGEAEIIYTLPREAAERFMR